MNPKDTLLNGGPLADHLACYANNRDQYVEAVVETRSNKNVAKAVQNSTWANVLVVLLHNKDRAAFAQIKPHVELLEIVKACEMLDAPRAIRQLRKKLATRRNNTLANKLRRLESEACDGETIVAGLHVNSFKPEWEKLSLTRSKIEMVRGWVASLSGKELMFQALMFPTDPWKTLADLCHLNPTKDFAVDWFLPYCFGQEPPEDSVIYRVKHGDAVTVCKEYELNYELARVLVKGANRDHKFLKYYVDKESLETVLWYYEEFEQFGREIAERLKNVEDLKLSYGKLMDLLMKTHNSRPAIYTPLLKLAERRLKDYKMNLEGPVAVLGDASASMQVAINTSSIITSLLCSLADAELHLFKTDDIPVNKPPRTVSDAVSFAKTMRADQATSPAASLYYYYKNKKAIKTFIVVTDEEENTGYDRKQSWYNNSDGDNMFAKLYDKYCAEIGPARLVFVSFTTPNRDGQMVKALKEVIGESKAQEWISTYKFDTRNPDLTKLDYVLEKLAKPVATAESSGWLSGWFSVSK